MKNKTNWSQILTSAVFVLTLAAMSIVVIPSYAVHESDAEPSIKRATSEAPVVACWHPIDEEQPLHKWDRNNDESSFIDDECNVEVSITKKETKENSNERADLERINITVDDAYNTLTQLVLQYQGASDVERRDEVATKIVYHMFSLLHKIQQSLLGFVGRKNEMFEQVRAQYQRLSSDYQQYKNKASGCHKEVQYLLSEFYKLQTSMENMINIELASFVDYDTDDDTTGEKSVIDELLHNENVQEVSSQHRKKTKEMFNRRKRATKPKTSQRKFKRSKRPSPTMPR